MEPWVPQSLPQPQGKPMASSKDPDGGLRSRHHRPVPHPPHNGERFHQWQDIRGSPQPQQDPRMDQPLYASRLREWPRPGSGVDYYEDGYPTHLYSGYGFRAWNGPRSPRCLSTDHSFPSFLLFYFTSFSFSTLPHCLSSPR